MHLKKLFFCLAFILSLQPLRSESYPAERPYQRIDTLGLYDEKVQLLKNWELYFVQDQLSILYGTTPVSKKNSLNLVDSLDLSSYTGVCWFRKQFRVDSSFRNKSVTFEIHLIGAAELYLNGKFIKEIGQVGNSEESEVIHHSSEEYVALVLDENKLYDLQVRFSNHKLQASYNNGGRQIFGVKVFVKNTNGIIAAVKEHMMYTIAAISFLIFFVAFSFVHLVIYLFNRSEKGNLYYSIFCFLVALFIFSFQAGVFISDALLIKYFGFFIILASLAAFSILPYMFRSFFQLKIPRWYKYMLAVPLACAVLFLLRHETLANLLLIIIVVYVLIESLRNLVLAFKKKKKGAQIIIAGLVLFSVFIVSMIVSGMTGGISTESEWASILLILFFILSIISIPVSITVFLAYSISLTNKSLKSKLQEVEQLSAKSIEQEKEKQQILADQNVTLEKQVTERTLQITEQKKVIEEKNKDIIDSINYAKHIQSAMLPDEDMFKNIFPDAFVLYQPRDIVSGDFYYVAEVNDQKLIIAADCTGHGVPGALMSMVGSNIIHKLVYENKIVQPSLLLQTLHSELRHALKQDTKGSVNRDGMDAAVVLVSEKEITYAGANRPLFWFNHLNELQEIKPTKTPVGGSHIESIQPQVHVLPKENVKQLYLFSDGFADQFGGPDGKKLMLSRFKEWLIQISPTEMTAQHEFLHKNFSGWKQDTEQVDDVMVIGIKIA